MLPSLFLSHGSPMLALTASPARDFLSGLAARLERPQAILVASAHWETRSPALSAPAVNETIYDFYGFPPELYAMTYPAPGARGLAERAAAMLAAAGLDATIGPARGLDHGAWSPLSLIYPAHDIPVAQIAMQTPRGPAHHLALGAALAGLRAEGVLIIGSGSFTHNLGRLRDPRQDAPAPPDVTAFADWMDAALRGNDREALIDYRAKAPFAAMQHPTEEHLLPLFVAMGAGGAAAKVERLHASASHGVLRMDAYAFQ